MHAAMRAAPLLTLLVGACDLPTSLPKWDTQWQIPVKSTTLSVGQLLPSNVTIASDKSAFQVAVQPVTFGRSLSQLCGSPCVVVSGQTVPKPAFTATFPDTLRLPTDVAQATLTGGTVSIGITNGLGFDPIRPSATARGSIVLTLTSGGTTLGTLTLDGNTDALPANATTTRSLTLSGGVVAGKIAVNMTLTSPAGDAVRIDSNQQLSITATPQNVRVSDATVAVSQKMVSMQAVDLDVSDIDQSLVNHVKGGALLLTINNPFAVTGTMTVRIAGTNVSIARPIQLTAGTSTQNVQFTPQEIQAILGKAGVTFSASGPINATSAIKITPAQSVLINAQLQLTLGPQEG
jgi:hypothetical protein